MKKKKIIIFGGSFDPIHKGHIKIALRAFNRIKADKLFFVPCNNHPQNKKMSASNSDRLEMIRLAIKGFPRFEICDFELKRNEISYTIDTINYFKEYYSDYELYLLIGYDQLINFDKWNRYQDILENSRIICYKRFLNKQNEINNITNDELNTVDNSAQDLSLQKEDDKKINIKHISIGTIFRINISSSEIRISPKKRHLSLDVLNYINENGLYAIDRLEKVMSTYRIEHSIRVAEIAVDITKSLKYYPLLKQAYVSAIYHDYAKEFSEKYQTNFWTLFKIGYLFKYKKMYNKEKTENKHKNLWKIIHAWLGAYLIKKKFFINDYQVLNAIRNHTILETDDNILAKIIFCSDKLDVRKDGEISDRKKMYELCKKDINKGYLEILNKLKRND